MSRSFERNDTLAGCHRYRFQFRVRTQLGENATDVIAHGVSRDEGLCGDVGRRSSSGKAFFVEVWGFEQPDCMIRRTAGCLDCDERYLETQLFTIIPVPHVAMHAADVATPMG